MVPRVVKHGGMVSLGYPWYVTSAVKAHLGLLNVLESNQVSTDASTFSENRSDNSEVDISDLSLILREVELEGRSDLIENEDTNSALNDFENIRTIARTLWRRRVGVLIHSNSPTLNAK
jgi:hypothetical protein